MDNTDPEKAKYDNIYSRMDYNAAFKEMSPEENALRRLDISHYPRHICTALSVGSGTGRGFRYLRDCGYDAFAVDISSEVYKYYIDEPERFFVAPADNLPFENGLFDLTICCDVLEHIPTDRIPESLEEIARVSRGKVIIQVFMATTERVPHMHETVKQKDWWISRLKRIGNITHAYIEAVLIDNGFERLTVVIERPYHNFRTGERKRVCLDIDGCLLSFNGWDKGKSYGEPLPGAIEFVRRVNEMCDVVLYSNRICEYECDDSRLILWKRVGQTMRDFGFPFSSLWIHQGKPVCDFYIDDLAVTVDPLTNSAAYRNAVSFIKQKI
jgi:SAM-dependent methyltransferase